MEARVRTDQVRLAGLAQVSRERSGPNRFAAFPSPASQRQIFLVS